jgi:hypothetical protein
MRTFEAAEKSKSIKTVQCLHVIPPPFLFILAFLVVPREADVNNNFLIVFLVVLHLVCNVKTER